MSIIPQEPQHMTALHRANETRLALAAFKQELAGLEQGDAIARVIDALERRHHEPTLGAAKVRHLLMGIHLIGSFKAAKLLQVAQVYDPDKRLRELTERQRGLLADLLSERRWRS